MPDDPTDGSAADGATDAAPDRPGDVVALISDLMDRSRLTAALGAAVRFAARAADVPADATVVVVDLARFARAIPEVRGRAPHARIVAFGPHIDDAAFAAARVDGADVALARSRFFRDVAGALAATTDR